MKLQHTATLHERTVQGIATGALSCVPRATGARNRQVTTTRHLKVHPLVMHKARELAGGTPGRIRIISESEVLVLNQGRK